MKSRLKSVDAEGMRLLAESSFSSSPVLVITAMFAAAVVWIALKSIARELEYAERIRVLREEANALRERQMERLRNLAPRQRRF